MGKNRQKANLTSNNLITSDITNDRIGINSTSPTATLDVVGIVSATSFYGDGSNITGISTNNITDYGVGLGGGGGGAIGIQSGGTSITSAASTINFVGAGITMADDGSVTDIYIPISTRSVSRTVATESQTTITGLTYSVGYVDVYLNGSKLDSTEFTATDGTSVVLTTGASANDVIEIVAQNVSATTVVSSDGITQSESIVLCNCTWLILINI